MKHTEEMQEQAYSDALSKTQGTVVILGKSCYWNYLSPTLPVFLLTVFCICRLRTTNITDMYYLLLFIQGN